MQHVTAKVWYTEVEYTMMVDGEQVTEHDMLEGRINDRRARLAIERSEGRPCLVTKLTWHYDKARMSARDFVGYGEILESK